MLVTLNHVGYFNFYCADNFGCVVIIVLSVLVCIFSKIIFLVHQNTGMKVYATDYDHSWEVYSFFLV